jgi:hypothetical protein
VGRKSLGGWLTTSTRIVAEAEEERGAAPEEATPESVTVNVTLSSPSSHEYPGAGA